MSPSSLFITIEKHIQFILELLGTSWLTYIVSQLFSFCPVLGITQRTNISWEWVGTIALLQLSACYLPSTTSGIASVVNTGADAQLVQIVSGFFSCLEARQCVCTSASTPLWVPRSTESRGSPSSQRGSQEERLRHDSSLSTFIYCTAWQQGVGRGGREAEIEGLHLIDSLLQDTSGRKGVELHNQHLWGRLCSLSAGWEWIPADMQACCDSLLRDRVSVWWWVLQAAVQFRPEMCLSLLSPSLFLAETEHPMEV